MTGRIIFWIAYFSSWILFSYLYIGDYSISSSTLFPAYLFGYTTIGIIVVCTIDILVLKFSAKFTNFWRKFTLAILSVFYLLDATLRIVDLVVMHYFGSRFNENVWLHLKYLKTVPIFALTIPGLSGILFMIVFCFFQVQSLIKITNYSVSTIIKTIILGSLCTAISLANHYINPTEESYNLITMYYSTPSEYVFSRGIYLYFEEAWLLDEEKVHNIKFSEQTGIKVSNSEYPLWKSSIYLDSKNKHTQSELNPNIIIVIIESFSRHFYTQKTTPNLWNFAKSGYDFEQIYSATRPTLQGLIAILGSYIFIPTQTQTALPNSKFSINSDFYFIPRALKKVVPAYEALHLQSNYGFYGDFKYLMMRNGYNDFKGQETEEIRKFSTALADPLNGIGDHGLYEYLIQQLEQKKITTPFFLSVLTADTHIPMQVSAGDYPKFGDRMLDSFVGMDFEFGKFWNYFKNSPYAQNTILIVTGDHSMYPNQDYYELRKKFNLEKFNNEKEYRPPQLERIPLLIYVPEKLKLDRDIDTTVFGTNLDIAPTLMDIIGIDMPNPFLGVSLISERAKYQSLLMTDYLSIPKGKKDYTLNEQDDYLKYFKYLTWKDKLVPPEMR